MWEPEASDHESNECGPGGLHKALSADGNPSFATIVKVARALGLRIRLTPAA